MHPLSPSDVLELVARGHLVPPTEDEISDKSKRDAFSKGVAIAQTLWFVTQCVERGLGQLEITILEVMTLAYTFMTVAMYIAWWHKPLNINCAIRVPVEDIPAPETSGKISISERIVQGVIGKGDEYVDLHQCKGVPLFWAGEDSIDSTFVADVVAILAAMVFGAVHCIAWSTQLLSQLERDLWQWSVIAIITIPITLSIFFILSLVIYWIFDRVGKVVILALYAPIVIAYIAARLILIVLSFTSLRGLPLGAYQTTEWSAIIPHI